MARRYFNWKLATVLVLALAVLIVTAFGLRHWRRSHLAEQGLTKGSQAFEKGQWEEAARGLGQYLARVPDDVPILFKYAEAQLNIRPLKQANYVNSIRGPKGGHMLSKAPEEISVGEVVALLEGSSKITGCAENPELCDRVESCLTRHLWIEAAKAMYDKLNSITFADLLNLTDEACRIDAFDS